MITIGIGLLVLCPSDRSVSRESVIGDTVSVCGVPVFFFFFFLTSWSGRVPSLLVHPLDLKVGVVRYYSAGLVVVSGVKAGVGGGWSPYQWSFPGHMSALKGGVIHFCLVWKEGGRQSPPVYLS